MKIQLDTDKKTIKLESSEILRDVVNVLEQLIGKEWKDWTLKNEKIDNRSFPIGVTKAAEPLRPYWDNNTTLPSVFSTQIY
ncbi:MAG: hypothetical protein KGI72_05455 [Patescibacteria group bacterium]|nr:hypothetical protein [Patescibacteria group bacterium]